MTETKLQPKSRGLDMLHGSIADKLFYFAMPIGLMGLFEQLFNSADVFLLGHFVGKDAMAAVGNNMPVIGLLVTLLIGISLGANVVIAQYLGAGKQDKVEETVQTAIVMALGLGVLLAAVGELIASPALKLLAVPPEVHDLAATYLRIFLLGMPFLTLYNFEAAIFRSCGDGKTPLYSLVAANILNITLDLLSVTVLGWGLTGVVSATVLSFAVNSGILFVLLCRTPQPIRLQRHHMRLNGHEMGKILHIGLPAGIQGMVFALSNVVIFHQQPGDCCHGCSSGFGDHRIQYLLFRQRVQPGHHHLCGAELRGTETQPVPGLHQSGFLGGGTVPAVHYAAHSVLWGAYHRLFQP